MPTVEKRGPYGNISNTEIFTWQRVRGRSVKDYSKILGSSDKRATLILGAIPKKGTLENLNHDYPGKKIVRVGMVPTFERDTVKSKLAGGGIDYETGNIL